MHLAMGAAVRASDNDTVLGHVDKLIVHSQDNSITHLVLRKGLLLPTDVVVPISAVHESDNAIRLTLSEEAAKTLPEFNPGQFHLPAEHWVPPMPYISGVGDFLLWSENAEAEVNVILADQGDGTTAALSAGTAALSDGTIVGMVEDVILDEATGEISEIVLRRGLLRHHDVTITMAEVAYVDETGVHLTLSEADVQTRAASQDKRVL